MFIPSSLVVVVFGVLMVIESDAWAFDQLWIVMGLVGYFATFVTGLAVLKPRGEYLAEAMEREGMSDHVASKMRELLVLARIDFLVLTWCGGQLPEGWVPTISLIGTIYWLAFFLIVLPVLGLTEKPLAQPKTIEEDFDMHYSPDTGGTRVLPAAGE